MKSSVVSLFAALAIATTACRDRAPLERVPSTTAPAATSLVTSPSAPSPSGAASSAAPSAFRVATPDDGSVVLATLPLEAQRTLALIKAGGPFPYAKDGTTFMNFERRLPQRPRGYYREYTVPTPGEKTRGARRIVAGEGPERDVRRSGEYYYTADHYQSFRRILE